MAKVREPSRSKGFEYSTVRTTLHQFSVKRNAVVGVGLGRGPDTADNPPFLGVTEGKDAAVVVRRSQCGRVAHVRVLPGPLAGKSVALDQRPCYAVIAQPHEEVTTTQLPELPAARNIEELAVVDDGDRIGDVTESGLDQTSLQPSELTSAGSDQPRRALVAPMLERRSRLCPKELLRSVGAILRPSGHEADLSVLACIRSYQRVPYVAV